MSRYEATQCGGHPVSCRRMALTSSMLYFLVCASYILVSGYVAAERSQSVEELKVIETVKGLVFITATSFLFFGLSLAMLRRMERAERLVRASQEALMDAERRSLAGLFASSIAHDMRNILTIVGIGIDDLRRGRAGEASALPPEKVEQALQELNQLSRRLLTIGKEGMNQDMAVVDLREALKAAIDFARSHPKVRDCHIAVHATEAIRTKASPHLIQLMVLNLLLNASDATKGHGHLRVTLHRVGAKAEIVVEDNGPGIQGHTAEEIFTPFVTTKAGGTGLGLLSVQAVVQGHGGSIEVGASEMGGASFSVRLPIQE
jgi:signal transduction histidine kinase